MTLNQLLKEVFALGFDEADELDDAFVFSANRALKMIFTELAPPTRVKITLGASDAKSFDLTKRVSDPFLIISAPKASSGEIIKGAYTEGYTVTLPESFVGNAFVYYKPLPRELSLNDGEKEIDIPPYATHLLPLLTASFVLFDDDEEKADYYMSVYRNEAAKIRHLYSLSQNNTYTDVTGWA